MMLKFTRIIIGAAVIALLTGGSLLGEVFRMSNGNELVGTLSDANEDGIVINLDVGGFSPRTHWIQFDQPTLLMLATNPGMEPYVFPYIEIPEEEIATPQNIPVNLPANRYQPPDGSKGILAGLLTPVGMVILITLFLANLYAAYEIARYRDRPMAVVCGASAVLPVIAPILFLCIPDEGEAGDAAEGDYGHDDAAAGGETAAAPAAAAGRKSSLSLGARPDEGGANTASLDGQIWQRGDQEFNRKFFETTFTSFFRVVPSADVKDLLLTMRCGRTEIIGKRISRISGTDLHLVLLNGSEKSVTFNTIDEVKVRHKNARS